jgi:hypothetical protein
MSKQPVFYLEWRGGSISLYHFIVLNLGSLYYIENGKYDVRDNDFEKLVDDRLVDLPSSPLTYPITICMNEYPGVISKLFSSVFDIISDKFTYVNTLPQGDQYEVLSIYGERCSSTGCSDNAANVFPYLRNLFLPKLTPPILRNKRIFIGRKQSIANNASSRSEYVRTILNEEEFVVNLAQFNIECVYLENNTVKQNMELFDSAEVIMSTNGSALTFLLWANPSARVIEICNKGAQFENCCQYELISNVLGLQYNKYSNIVEDEKGNMTIDNDSDIYNYIQNIIGTIGN